MIPFPSEEEFNLIKKYALLPFVFAVFKRDKGIIEQSEIKTITPYMELMDRSIKAVVRDMIQVKKDLMSHGIKILSEDKDEKRASIKFLYKKYEHLSEFPLILMKGFIEDYMRGYLGVEAK